MARIKVRRDTAANWIEANPILDLAEPGYETDTAQLKFGNGVDDWVTLPYFFGGFDGGIINNPLEITSDGNVVTTALDLSGAVNRSSADAGLLKIGTVLGFDDINIMASLSDNVNDYTQLVIQNRSGGDSASSDLIVNNDVSGAVYGDFGINSSGFVGTGGPFDNSNSTYLYSAGGELAIGTKEPYNMILATNSTSRVEFYNTGKVEFQPSARVSILNTTDSTAHDTGALVIEGGLGVGKTIVADDKLYLGQDAVTTNLTNPTLTIKKSGGGFIQAAIINIDPTASADWISYGDNSTDTDGWANIGWTGSTFNDPAYTITGPNDGYFFVQGTSSMGGKMVIATGDLGDGSNDIIFATNGFASANERMRLNDSAQTLQIKMTTGSVNSSTGALTVDGGVGVDQNLNVGGKINNITVTPPASPATFTLGSGKTFSVPESITMPNIVGSAGSVVTANGSGVLTYTAQSDIQVTKFPLVTVTGSDYSASVSNNIICIDPAGTPRTVTLSHTVPLGKVYTIKNIGSGTVTVDTDNVFCQIDGSPTYSLSGLDAVTVVLGTDGVNNTYYIIGKV